MAPEHSDPASTPHVTATPDAAAPTPAADSSPTPGPSPAAARGSRFRWAVASIVTLLVLAASAAGFMMLSAGAATSALVGFVPAGSVGYLEVRLDAPGDQRQNAANFLSHFPGFADQANLNTKMDEALDQLMGRVTNGSQSFTADLKPWLGDSLAFVMTRAPDMSGAASGAASAAASAAAGGSAGSAAGAAAAAARPTEGLVLVSVKDGTAALGWTQKTLGGGPATDTYAGIALTTTQVDGAPVQYGVVSNVLVIGDPESVHGAIDSHGKATFGDSASFKAAAAAVPGDRLAFGFLDLHAVGVAYEQAHPEASGGSITPEQLPAWIAVSVRAESDWLNLTVALPQTNLAAVTANHTSVIATRLPATTLGAVEMHDLGTVLAVAVATLRPDLGGQGGSGAGGSGAGGSGQGTPSQLDQALKALGGPDALVRWITDGSIAVVRTGGSADLSAGVVLQAKDASAAETKLLQLKNLAALVGPAQGITVSEEPYAGTTITIIDAGDAARLLPADSMLGAFVPPGAHLQVAVAQEGDLVIAGLGDAFVKAVLDTTPGSSLADQPAYRDAIDHAGVSNTGQLYVDLAAAMDVVAARLPASEQQYYRTELKPYLERFRAFAATISAGDPNRARLVITAR